MKYNFIILLTLALCGGFILGFLFNKYVFSDYFHVYNITAEHLIDSIMSDSLKYEKKRVEFIVKMKERGWDDCIIGDVGEHKNIRWYIYTNEKDNNEWYIPGEKYRFKIYIKEIKYMQSDDRYVVRSKVLK